MSFSGRWLLAARRLLERVVCTAPRLWLASSVLIFLLAASWSVAMPYFAANDEVSSVQRAAAVVRGDLLGNSVKDQPFARAVKLPPELAQLKPPCFVVDQTLSPSCQQFTVLANAPRTAAVLDGAESPAYFAVVGLPTLVDTSPQVVFWMRILGAALIALLAGLVPVAVRAVSRRGWLEYATLIAITPAVVYGAGTLGVDGPLLVSSVLLWIALGGLLSGAARSAYTRNLLISSATAGGVVLLLSRSTGMLLFLAPLVLFALLYGRESLEVLTATKRAKAMVAAWAVSAVAASAWIAVAATTGGTGASSFNQLTNQIWSAIQATDVSIANSIGLFEWQSIGAPGVTYYGYLALAFSLLAIVLVACGRRARIVVVLSVAAAVAIGPATALFNGLAGTGNAYPRLAAPLLLGVVILSGFALDGQRDIFTANARRRLTVIAGLVVAVAQFAALYWVMRQYVDDALSGPALRQTIKGASNSVGISNSVLLIAAVAFATAFAALLTWLALAAINSGGIALRLTNRAYRRYLLPGLMQSPLAARFAEVPRPLIGVENTVATVTTVHGAGPKRLVQRSKRSLTAAPAANQSIGEASWTVFLPAGDAFLPGGYQCLTTALAAVDQSINAVTWDEIVKRRFDSGYLRVYPGPSPDRQLVERSFAGAVALRSSTLSASDLAALTNEAAAQLAVVIGAGSHCERQLHLQLPLTSTSPKRSWNTLLDVNAARERVSSANSGLTVETDGDKPCVRHSLTTLPSVEVVIPFKDKPELLERAVESLLAVTDWPDLRVTLVDNGSSETTTALLLKQLGSDVRIKVKRDDRQFNFAALNNSAVAESDSEFIVFLNNDTVLIEPDWLKRLVEHAAREEIGAVAPLLVYPDGKVQHAGVAVGLTGYAGHPFAGLKPEVQTPFGAAQADLRNWLAVTAACLVVERRKFDQVGCFDEQFVVGGNDVDLCLRLTKAGFRSLCVTSVTVVHDESRSRGTYVDPGDFAASERSYGEFRTVGDPFYSPSLTLQRSDCSLPSIEEAALI